MKVCFTTIFLCLYFVVIKALDKKSENECFYVLHTFNDGPVTLDLPVTISAILECADEEDEYLFVFEDDIMRKIVIQGHQSANASFVFADKPGKRTIKVSAYALLPQKAIVCSRTTTVEVHEYIQGTLEFSDVVADQEGKLYVPADKDINISLKLAVPHYVLDVAEFSYSWTIGDFMSISNQPYLLHRFPVPGPQSIIVAVVARIPLHKDTNVSRYKWGYFNTRVSVKYPFENINITGNTYLQHGQLLNLDISCNGSGPINYCWKILPASDTNLSCSYPDTVLECNFPIIYYFQEFGDFLLVISVDNLISSRQRNIEIHVYDVSTVPQLSTIIIPVVCTVLALLIVVSAVVIHIRRTRSYDVETADFDFMMADDSGTIVVETSWEYMQRTFLQLLRIPQIYYSIEIQKINYGSVIPD